MDMPNDYTPQNAAYYEGVTDVYYALMTTPDTMSQAPEYGAPVCAGKTIEIQVTPNYTEGKVYASNVSMRRHQRPDSYAVQLNPDQLIPSVRRALLGREAGTDGVEIVKGSNMAPWVAIMFTVTLDDGSIEFRALYKGRFSEPTNTHHTRNDGDSYQHPVIQGVFIPLSDSGFLSVEQPDDGTQNLQDWFEYVKSMRDPGTLLSNVRMYNYKNGAYTYADISPAFSQQVTEYAFSGTKTNGGMAWYISLSKNGAHGKNARSDGFDYDDGSTVIYDYAGIPAADFTHTVMSGGALYVTMLGARNSSGCVKAKVKKGGNETEYTFNLSFNYQPN